MKIRNVVHRGFAGSCQDDHAAGVQPAVAPKLRRIVSFVQDVEWEEQAQSAVLAGAQADRRPPGTWSLSVTANRRLTLRIDREEMEIVVLNHEDYH